MKLRAVSESYDGLPDEDQFMDMKCCCCGGQLDLYACDCGDMWCEHCVNRNWSSMGLMQRARDYEPDFEPGRLLCCPRCRSQHIKESYEGLPDEDEFEENYLSCDGCGRDTDSLPHDYFMICQGPSGRSQYPGICGYTWCDSCANPLIARLNIRGEGWRYDESGELIKCPACSPKGISWWKTMRGDVRLGLDESYDGLPDDDEFEENLVPQEIEDLSNFLISHDVACEPRNYKLTYPEINTSTTTDIRYVDKDGNDVTQFVMSHPAFDYAAATWHPGLDEVHGHGSITVEIFTPFTADNGVMGGEETPFKFYYFRRPVRGQKNYWEYGL